MYHFCQAPSAASRGSVFQQSWFRYFDRSGDIIHLLNAAGEPMQSYRLAQCRIFAIVDLASGDTQTLRSGDLNLSRAITEGMIAFVLAMVPLRLFIAAALFWPGLKGRRRDSA
ncbi:MAG: hypothetical protein WB609_08825 [Candidatus Cybelea sp.]